MAGTTVSTFVSLVRKSQLLNPEQLKELGELHARLPEAKALAKELIRRDWLTAYQINQISQGKGDNLLLGQYVIQERLGEGGMGQVFKARHRSLGRTVALKVIRKDRLANPDAIRRFQREIQAAASLSHRNVVLAYDADEINGTHFFAMEYVEGIDLSRLVKQFGPLPLDKACDYIYQAALGLQHAHERGLVHRDIKPANFLLTKKDATVKILDMGLARLGEADADSRLTTLTQDGKVMGTPDYIAPEQARNSHTADIRADLYSLGCTFYFLLSGRVPFPGGDSVMEKLMKHQMEDPVPIEQVRPDVPENVREILKRLIARRPEDRFQTPAEAAAALEPLVFNPATHGLQATQPLLEQGITSVPHAPPQMLVPTAVRSDTSCTSELPPPPPTRGVGRLLGATLLLFVKALFWLIVLLVRPGPSRTRRILRGFLAVSLLLGGGALFVTKSLTKRQPGKTPEVAASFDQLNSEKIPPEKLFANPPRELVAVFGDPRGRHGGLGSISRVLYSPDGRLIASASSLNNTAPSNIYLWDAKTLRELACLRLENWLSNLSFSLESRTLTGVCSNGEVHIWDVTSRQLGTLLKKYSGPATQHLAISADGRFAAGVTWGAKRAQTIHVWELATGAMRHTFPVTARNIISVAFSPDGRLLAGMVYDADGAVVTSNRSTSFKIWELEPIFKERASIPNVALAYHNPVFSKDGKAIALLSRNLKIFNTETGAEIRSFNAQNGYILNFAVSPDFKCLAMANTTGQGTVTITLVDLEKGNVRHRLPDLGAQQPHMSFSPNGKSLIVSGPGLGTRAWNVDNGQEIPFKSNAVFGSAQPHSQDIRTLAVSPDSRTLVASGNDMSLYAWDLSTGADPFALGKRHTFVTYLDFFDEQSLAIGCGEIDLGRLSNDLKLWNPVSNQEEVVIRDRSGFGFWDYEPKQKWFATASFIAEAGESVPVAKVWNAAGREVKVFTGLSQRTTINNLAFAPDGNILAVSWIPFYRGSFTSGTSGITLWDTASRTEQRTIKLANPAHGLAYSPDGKILAAIIAPLFQDAQLKLWDAATLKPRDLPDVSGTTVSVASMAFAPDGKTIATGSSNHREEKTIMLWDVQSGKVVQQLAGHTTQIQSLAYSADGRLLASSSLDGRLIIWNLETGAKLHQMSLPGPALRMRFHAQGRYLAIGNANGTAYVFRLTP